MPVMIRADIAVRVSKSWSSVDSVAFLNLITVEESYDLAFVPTPSRTLGDDSHCFTVLDLKLEEVPRVSTAGLEMKVDGPDVLTS